MIDRTIEVSAPADAESVAILRSVAANVIARTDAPIDAVDDLRIAVAEACNRLLTSTPGAERLHLTMSRRSELVEARVSVLGQALDRTTQPAEDPGLGWTIIEGLTDHAEEITEHGEPTIVMRVATPASRGR